MGSGCEVIHWVDHGVPQTRMAAGGDYYIVDVTLGEPIWVDAPVCYGIPDTYYFALTIERLVEFPKGTVLP
jgi:hypothetical protein